jgi:hypothetical protein
MARTSLQNVQSVKDVLQTWNWDVFFPTIPGVSDTRPFSYKMISASVPGSVIEPVKLESHGVQLNFAGRRTWSGTWEATVVESRDNSSRALLVAWMEYQRSWVANSGNYKADYAVTGELVLYDDIPKEVANIWMYGMFPSTIGDATLDNTSGIVQYAVTFSYDYTEDKVPG